MTPIITTEDKLREAKRELQMREDVYPLWIEQGRLSRASADRLLAIQREIVGDYETMAAQLKLPI